MVTYMHNSTDAESHTGRAKARDLELFLEHAESYGAPESPKNARGDVPMLWDVTRGMVERFIAWRLSEGDAPSTVNRRLATVRHFAASCERTFPDFRSEVTGIRGIDAEPPVPLSFSDDEMFRLRAAAMKHPEPFRARRARLILELGASMGLRCFEMTGLTIASFFPDGLAIRGKGRKFRQLPIHPRVRTAHALYMPERLAIGPGLPHLPLLVASWPRQMTVKRLNEKTVYTLIRELGDAAGVEHAHPHRLRHTFVKKLLETSGNNMALVAYAARHSNIQSTLRYATPFRTELEAAFANMDCDDDET
jgi:site-specific recombinase XerD